MNRTVAILLTGLFLSGSVNSQTTIPFSYQGNIPGSTTFQDFAAHLSAADSRILSSYYCGEAINGLRLCRLTGTLETHYSFVDDKLARVSVNFNSASYLDDYVDSLTKKFGRPKKTLTTYQNGFGATRNARVWTWQNATGGITLSEIGAGQDFQTGELNFYDTKLRTEFLDRFHPKPTL